VVYNIKVHKSEREKNRAGKVGHSVEHNIPVPNRLGVGSDSQFRKKKTSGNRKTITVSYRNFFMVIGKTIEEIEK